MKKLTLYQLETCPYCITAREALDEKGIKYEVVNVPGPRPDRKEVIEISGQAEVPVLVVEEEGKKQVIFHDEKIIEYINEHPELSK